MKLYFKAILLLIFLTTLTISSPTEAVHAHGIGGLDASRTTSEVISVTPKTSAFSVKVVENSENIIFTRNSNESIIILGIDSEPYLLLNTDGVFENKLSPTRLINDQSTEDYSPEKARQEFAQTSDDPNAEPDWQKVSSSNSFRFHDHRAHYMAEVPSGVTDLGTSEMNIIVGSQPHVITFGLIAGEASNPWWALVLLSVAIASFIVLYIFARNIFEIVFSRKIIAILALVVVILQALYIYGFAQFTYDSVFFALGQSVYAFAVILLFVSVTFIALKSKLDTENFYRRYSPLMFIAGITGLIAGAGIEFSSLIEPFPASVLSIQTVRSIIVFTALLSSLFLVIGAFNVKPVHTLEQTEALQD